LTICYHKLAD